ncbi:MAG: NAD(P)H-quinone oxidoreductase [Gemmatimonadaceae bacterium]
MRAAIIRRFGDPDVLEVNEVPVPEPGPREIQVRVHTSALNRADILQRMGRYPPPGDAPRDIPGMEFAGEVSAVGPGQSLWSIGDRVFGLVAGGAHAEYLVTHEEAAVAIPDGLSWEAAGAVPEVFITAHDALVMQAGLRPGHTVLIHAVGSGVGLAATQIARAWGAIPYGTSRTPDKLEAAKRVGLEDGVVVEAEPDAFVAAARRWTGGRGVDVVCDLVGGPYVPASIDALALKGQLMLIGTIAGPRATLELGRVLGKRLTIRGTVLRARPLDEKIAVAQAFARDVVPRLARGELVPSIDSVYSLEHIADAHRRMESNLTTGKVMLALA